MSANHVEVGIGVKNAGLKKGFDEARKHAEKFRDDLRGELAGAIGFGGIAAGIKNVIEYGDQIDDLSQRFGVGSVALQRWGNVAEQNGASLEEVAGGLNKLTIAQDKALSGDEELRSHFERLGVSMTDLKALGPDELMSKIGKSSMNAADMVAVMGKSALSLIPTLQAVADGTAEFGAVMDEHTIKTLGAASDRIKGLSNTLRSYFGGAVIWATDRFATLGAFVGGVVEHLDDFMHERISTGNLVGHGIDSAAQQINDRDSADEKRRLARDQEGQSATAAQKARDLVDKLNDLKEKNAARERSDAEQLEALRNRAIDQEETIEGLKGAGVDATEDEIELEQLRGQIAEQVKKIEDAEVKTMIENAEVRERIADINEEIRNIRRNAAAEELDTSGKIADLQERIAENLAKIANQDDEKTAAIRKQNAELETQIAKLKQVEVQERQNALAKRVGQFLQTPQERANARRAEVTRERAERTVLARDRQRAKDVDARDNGIIRPPSVPKLLQRPAEQAIGNAVGKAVDNKVQEQLIQQTNALLDRIYGRLEPLN